ncbi:MAG: hypothetical protein M1826_003717 [Phylliscum demangeonii]|nr:MAG: hypothetical protein M1826_003717 [Phylliscum demangeonii]
MAATTATAPSPALLPTTPTSTGSPPPRPSRPMTAGSPSVAHPSRELAAARSSLSPKVLQSLTPRFALQPLNGMAALAAERRRSREPETTESSRGRSANPAVHAIEALLGRGARMSVARDAPKAGGAISNGLPTVAEVIASPPGVKPMEPQPRPPAWLSPLSASSVLAPNGTAGPATPPAAAAAAADRETVSFEASGGAAALVASPGALQVPGDGTRVDARHANRALTLPGPRGPLPVPGRPEPTRGASLPMPDPSPSAIASRATGAGGVRKHKCPYCATDFTRHHNLKSHLLTHSQEKPFVCPNCQARFRRLHDLKRHTKLHTGERPHICTRCGRRFARGDALARHHKGQAGCAGRRGSAGSVTGEDEDAAMTDVGGPSLLLYEGEGEGEGEADSAESDDRMEEDDDDPSPNRSPRRRRPSRTASRSAESSANETAPSAREPSSSSTPATGGAGGAGGGGPYRFPPHHPSTYPPPTARPGPPAPLPGPGPGPGARGTIGCEMRADTSSPRFPTGLFSSAGVTSSSPGPMAPGLSSILFPGSVTESPKPLSPGHVASPPPPPPPRPSSSSSSSSLHAPPAPAPRTGSIGSRRPRSPSLAQQLQQQHYGRRASSVRHRSPPPLHIGLPPPLIPHLPSLPGLGASAADASAKYALPAHHAASLSVDSALRPQPLPPRPGLCSGGGASLDRAGGGAGGGSVADGVAGRGYFPFGIDSVWSYIRSLETKIDRLADEVTGMRREMAYRAGGASSAAP